MRIENPHQPATDNAGEPVKVSSLDQILASRFWRRAEMKEAAICQNRRTLDRPTIPAIDWPVTEDNRKFKGVKMRYLHTMLRVRNLDVALKFYADALGLKEVRRVTNDKAKFTLVFLCADEDEGLLAQCKGRGAPLVELTYNWGDEDYGEARYFGHLAYEVDDIYATCDRLTKLGITINRPPRDGQMAFVRSPDLHSIEILQKGDALPPQEPWTSMANTGHW
jgi:lactoylglutathione lyase